MVIMCGAAGCKSDRPSLHGNYLYVRYRARAGLQASERPLSTSLYKQLAHQDIDPPTTTPGVLQFHYFVVFRPPPSSTMLARSNNRAAASGSCFDLQLVRVCIQFAKLRSSCSQQSRLPKASRDTLPSPKAKRAVKSTMANGVLTLPRSLERPAAKTTDSEGLRKDFAELNGVPNSFVREMVGEMAERYSILLLSRQCTGADGMP